ncbi:hypothetical protein OG589_41680 [Sphaerisporangium sp. NBC_01403]
MRALFRRVRPMLPAVTFDEARSQVCDAACLRHGLVDRARTDSLMSR